MPYKLNGNDAAVKLNGNDAIIKLNGEQVNPRKPTRWVYVGTNGYSPDAVYDGGEKAGSCATPEAFTARLYNNFPLENYPIGFIIRVDHRTNVFGTIQECDSYYYRAE